MPWQLLCLSLVTQSSPKPQFKTSPLSCTYFSKIPCILQPLEKWRGLIMNFSIFRYYLLPPSFSPCEQPKYLPILWPSLLSSPPTPNLAPSLIATILLPEICTLSCYTDTSQLRGSSVLLYFPWDLFPVIPTSFVFFFQLWLHYAPATQARNPGFLWVALPSACNIHKLISYQLVLNIFQNASHPL